MLEFTRLQLDDEDIVTEYYETYLNSGPSIRDFVHRGLVADGFVGWKCVDTETGDIVGMMSSRSGIEFTYEHPDLEAEVRERWGTEGVYSLDMYIVNPAYRHHGAGRELASLLLEGLRENHAKSMVLELWQHSLTGEVPALGPIQKACAGCSIVTVTEAKNFYKDLADYGLSCPECGSHCKCGALIAVLEIHASPSEERCHENKD